MPLPIIILFTQNVQKPPRSRFPSCFVLVLFVFRSVFAIHYNRGRRTRHEQNTNKTRTKPPDRGLSSTETQARGFHAKAQKGKVAQYPLSSLAPLRETYTPECCQTHPPLLLVSFLSCSCFVRYLPYITIGGDEQDKKETRTKQEQNKHTTYLFYAIPGGISTNTGLKNRVFTTINRVLIRYTYFIF